MFNESKIGFSSIKHYDKINSSQDQASQSSGCTEFRIDISSGDCILIYSTCIIIGDDHTSKTSLPCALTLASQFPIPPQMCGRHTIRWQKIPMSQ